MNTLGLHEIQENSYDYFFTLESKLANLTYWHRLRLNSEVTDVALQKSFLTVFEKLASKPKL